MLVKLADVLSWADARGCAIGAYNTPNLESLMAVMGEAEARKVPVIIAHAQVHEPVMPLDVIGPIMVDVAQRSSIPTCVHLDHGEDLDYIHRALDMGLTSAMYDGSVLPYDDNVRNTRELVRMAAEYGAGTEAEIGVMPGREASGAYGGGSNDPSSAYTDPELARRFVDDTGVEALACSFGTVHGFYTQAPKLDFDRIGEIRRLTGRPLVMHGGSGVSPDGYRRSIDAGVRKINYYSYMSLAGVEGAKQLLATTDVKFFHDLALAAKDSMAADVGRSMDVFYQPGAGHGDGSAGHSDGSRHPTALQSESLE